MKRIATQQQTSDIDMTPMLDIVFIMLIFFIERVYLWFFEMLRAKTKPVAA